MKARATVAHVTTTDISLELLLGPQLRAFQEAGYAVIGISAPGPWVEELEAGGIRHVPLHHATRAMSPVDDARALGELVGLFRRLRPTIVHTHNPKPGVYGRLAAWIANVPITVNTVHGLYALPEDPLPKRVAVYGLERLAGLASDAELVQNPEDLEKLIQLGVPKDKLHLLGNGIDPDRFDPGRVNPLRTEELRREVGAGPDDVVVGAVGRLVREKGYPELFEAARRVTATRSDVRFVVVGPDDPDKDDAITQHEIADAERDAGIRFLGLRHDVDELYTAFDVYVLASHREGFPRSAMEAATMGLPIVTTDIRGCREVVDHGVTGLLVPPRDPDGLADAIGRLVDDAGLRRKMGQAAADKATLEFDQQDQIDLTLGVYDRLLREKLRASARRRR